MRRAGELKAGEQLRVFGVRINTDASCDASPPHFKLATESMDREEVS